MALRVLSLGAGVQSSTLALMIEHGELPPIDAAVFANEKNKKQLDFEFGILNECEGMCGN